MITIPNECDLLGEGKEDKECDCSQDNLFEKAEEIFLEKDFQKLGKFTMEVIDNCVGNSKPKGSTKKRPPSEYNKFMSKKMKGCGKENAKSCSDTMKESAAEWQELKKQKSE